MELGKQIRGTRPYKMGARTQKPRKVDRRVAARWGSVKVVAHGFVPMAEVFLRAYGDLGISNSDAMLVSHLMSFKWNALPPYPSVELLAERMGMTERSMRAALTRLQAGGFVKRVRVEGQRRNGYDISGLVAKLETWIDGNGGTKAVT